jgi:hypothetical protein
MQSPCVPQQPTAAQKEPAGQSALLAHGVPVPQPAPVTSRQRFAPSVVTWQLQKGFVVLQGATKLRQLSPLHGFAVTQEPPLHASPALQQMPLQQLCPPAQQATTPPGAMQGVRPESLQALQAVTQALYAAFTLAGDWGMKPVAT